MPMVEANGAQFYYELHGKGHPVILIAGYTCDYTIWLQVVEGLSKAFQVLIFDNRAVGQTKDDGVPLTAELMAKDVMAIAKQLKLDHPHIVGQSMGGAIVQMIGALFPNDIGKLCILTSAARLRPAALYAEKTLLKMAEKNLDVDLIMDATIPWVFGNEFLENEENIRQAKKLTLENPYPQSFKDQARQCKVLEDFDCRSLLKKITAPTLIVYGKQDILTMPYESEFLAAHITNSTLVAIDSAHAITIEAAPQLANILINFFQTKI